MKHLTIDKSTEFIKQQSIIPFSAFLRNLKEKINYTFNVRENIDLMALKRGISPFALREIMSSNPLSVGIPIEYGGRGVQMSENLALLSVASYESLALSLTFGINSALFLQPVGKYADEKIKKPVFERFLKKQNMGGLMITEPGHGSDALNMQTAFTKKNSNFHIKGTKHWAGLTGWADFWLIVARERSKDGDLKRDLDFFICDENESEQHIDVEELYQNLGLYQIPYGRNRIDIKIPETHRLKPETTGIKMMLDLLHRSRMQFPGMAMGFIHRLLDEAIDHCKKRFVGGKSLLEYDQVQQRLNNLQASFTICSAMCANSSEKAGIENDLSSHGIEANSVKSVVTDLMQEAAQSVTQLVGAQAYKLNHIAGRGIIDSRPFQIFEGSNDILYSQISEGLIKLMKKAKEHNLFRFLKNFSLTTKASLMLKEIIDFKLDIQLPQRKLVNLGQILGRIISMEMVINLGEKGFQSDLIHNSLIYLKREIAIYLKGFESLSPIYVIEDFPSENSWLTFVPTPEK